MTRHIAATPDGQPLAFTLPAQRTVLLTPKAAAIVLNLIRDMEHRARGHGVSLSPQLRQLRSACAEAVADSGHTDVRPEAVVPPSISDPITIREAAELLHLSERHTRRLAATDAFGWADRRARTLLVSRAEVVAYGTHTR